VTLANLSFETAAATPGDASGWIWTRSAAFLFACFATPGGVSRFESFEFGWRMPSTDLSVQNYPFVDALAVPANAQALVFGNLGGTPAPFENFERQWRMPSAEPSSSPTCDRNGGHPPDLTHPGNETAFFVWASSLAAPFHPSGHVFEDFEAGWSADESYVWSFAGGSLSSAVFETHAFENFETGWKGNDTYHFTMGSLTAASFVTLAGSTAFEDFSSVKADLAVTFTPPHAVHALTLISVYEPCTFYNTGDGSLPPEINPRLTYATYGLVTSGPDTPYFQISLGGAGAVTFSATGSGSNFLKRDTTLYWTLTDVGI
jgi:hypothetical protein